MGSEGQASGYPASSSSSQPDQPSGRILTASNLLAVGLQDDFHSSEGIDWSVVGHISGCKKPVRQHVASACKLLLVCGARWRSCVQLERHRIRHGRSLAEFRAKSHSKRKDRAQKLVINRRGQLPCDNRGPGPSYAERA